MLGLGKKTTLPAPDDALAGRAEPIPTAQTHFVSGRPLHPPYPDNLEIADFGLGCFWGAERLFWSMDGVWVTAVGYQGGVTPNPTYQEVCSGGTGHAEVVRVVFDPAIVSYRDLVARFFESHDPTQGMRQGNDVGTQYRSAIYTHADDQALIARELAAGYGEALAARGFSAVTTQIAPAGPFYFAEDYHQQYLAKNPSGYCGIGGTGVTCPAPAAPKD